MGCSSKNVQKAVAWPQRVHVQTCSEQGRQQWQHVAVLQCSSRDLGSFCLVLQSASFHSKAYMIREKGEVMLLVKDTTDVTILRVLLLVSSVPDRGLY